MERRGGPQEMQEYGNKGECAISKRNFREGLIEMVKTEETSERDKKRAKGFQSVGKETALSKFMIFCMYVIHRSLDLPLFSYELVGQVYQTEFQRPEEVMTSNCLMNHFISYHIGFFERISTTK